MSKGCQAVMAWSIRVHGGSLGPTEAKTCQATRALLEAMPGGEEGPLSQYGVLDVNEQHAG